MIKQPEIYRRRVQVGGQVQGVGFRPYVYRLTAELSLTGWVLNNSSGVTLEIQGPMSAIEEFQRRLPRELPPLAKIARCEVIDVPAQPTETAFEIRPSVEGELADAQVTVDTAVCRDCLSEMHDAKDPRHDYPFINCTNCGPRYTIVRRIPYDRRNTSMAEFSMCPLCAGEYRDPASRRFHAQPVACPACGPHVWLVDPQGRQIDCEDAIAEAAWRLQHGQIVAIKGLGGFHLACRADDEHAVSRLRRRKRRDAKPFALMLKDLEQARELCQVPLAAEELLAGPLRPVVLLPRRPDAPIAPSVAENLDTLGIMLPYTPLHHLLMRGMPPLVMTSGNYSEEPLVKENDSAVGHLGAIAETILLHNRQIERRLDDSVVQVGLDGAPAVLRRARGYAPHPVEVGEFLRGAPPVLAVGAELKNAVCLLAGGRAVLSEHIGDLRDGRVYRHFIETIHHLESLFDVHPEVVAADMHPQYLSTEYALRRHGGQVAGRAELPVVHVQHHHAHAASCLVENGRVGPAIAIICDGVGYGDDGAVWGGEILRADLRGYDRLGHLAYTPLIGGDAAAIETWRPALAAMYETFGEDCLTRLRATRLAMTDEQAMAGVRQLTVGMNCPPSSSLGRWFDAVAALTGIAEANRCEGLAPMLLEAAIDPAEDGLYPFRLISEGPFLIDLRPMVEAIVADLSAGLTSGQVSARFHNTVAEFLVASAERAREETGIGVAALSGGCFANRHLTARLVRRLQEERFEVLRHHTVPTNDGGVALGQAVVAAMKKMAGVSAESDKMGGAR